MLVLKANKENSIHIFRMAGELNEPVIFPTDTIYGIGAPVTDIEANRKVYEAKGRERNKPFPVLAGSIEQVQSLIRGPIHEYAYKVWPGPVTLIMNAAEGLAPELVKDMKIAVRVPADEDLRELLLSIGAPVSATSANLSGKDYSPYITNIIRDFKNSIKFILNAGSQSGEPSAIVDLTEEYPKILRGTPEHQP
ncbi:L-threonylcarbamoyladenylate synthase [Limisalsivibrio acetivorans]|uniref:L-threonylcarbamoyladenylate synthase n=1 Tax=Limisalsivibrio acetivorans TaxID=1304888 RepID=UPI0003B34BEF|nr:L-threonylcarbamoyladenylate synthase [Limisalsivibrio acetivorans]